MVSRETYTLTLGYPAWAGIDPPVFTRFHFARRLPRVGGDRPQELLYLRVGAVVTPRGRG